MTLRKRESTSVLPKGKSDIIRILFVQALYSRWPFDASNLGGFKVIASLTLIPFETVATGRHEHPLVLMLVPTRRKLIYAQFKWSFDKSSRNDFGVITCEEPENNLNFYYSNEEDIYWKIFNRFTRDRISRLDLRRLRIK